MAADGVDVGEVAEEILGLFAEDGWDQPAVLADLAVTEHPDGARVSVSAARPLDGHPATPSTAPAPTAPSTGSRSCSKRG